MVWIVWIGLDGLRIPRYLGYEYLGGFWWVLVWLGCLVWVGMDWIVWNRLGCLAWVGLDWVGFDWVGLDRLDWTGLD